MSDQLKKVTDPFNSSTEITYDEVGRTKTVTGTWNGTNYTYANNVSYRAWGAVKSFTGGTTTSYNNRMLPTHFGAYDYTYYDDGKLKEFRDTQDQVGNPSQVQFHYMSRRYSYDHVGRVSSVGQLANYSVMPPFNGSYGYDAFDNLTSRSGNFAINPTQSDSASYTNNRRTGWTYNAEGKITNSSDSSDSGGSSTRAWTYDAAGRLTFNSEVRNGQTTTLATGYDGNDKVNHEIINNATGDYLIHSSVLGTLLTKLKVNGAKDITYVPANGVVYPMQMQDQPGSTPASYLSGVFRDPLGIQENGKAYDPFGNLVANVQPPSGGPPGYTPVYGPPYGWLTQNSFTNANNFSGGCYSAQNNNPALCSDVAQQVGLDRFNPEFWSNLPGAHNDNEYAQGIYNSHVDEIFRGWDHWQDGAWYWGWSEQDDKRPPTFRLNHAANPQNPPLRGERLRVFEEAYNLAWPALSSKACAKEISGNRSRKAGQYAASALSQIFDAHNFRAGGPSPNTTTVAITDKPGDRGKAVIRIYNEFFDPDYLENRALAAGATTKDNPVYQGAGIPTISSTTVMAIIILHELRHALTGKTHKGETDKQRNAWDARIFKACFPELQIKKKP